MSVLGHYVDCDGAVCIDCWNPEHVCETCGGTLGMPRDASARTREGAVFGVFPRYVTNGVPDDAGPKFVVCRNEEHWDGFESWDEPAAIFDDTESDSPTHCSECHELIPHELTSDGYKYVEDHARQHIESFGMTLVAPNAHSVQVVQSWLEQYGDWGDMNGILTALHEALYRAMDEAEYFEPEELAQ